MSNSVVYKKLKAIKQADLEILKVAAKEGEIRLVYLDEAGCCLESPVSYTYVQVNEQKRLEQAIKTYGHRISILGAWEENEHFDYALAQGGFRSESYIGYGLDSSKSSNTMAKYWANNRSSTK